MTVMSGMSLALCISNTHTHLCRKSRSAFLSPYILFPVFRVSQQTSDLGDDEQEAQNNNTTTRQHTCVWTCSQHVTLVATCHHSYTAQRTGARLPPLIEIHCRPVNGLLQVVSPSQNSGLVSLCTLIVDNFVGQKKLNM